MRTVTIKSVKTPFTSLPSMKVFDIDGVEIPDIVSLESTADLGPVVLLTYMDGRHEYVIVDESEI